MEYFISYTEPHKHFITIELHLEGIKSDVLHLQIPAWRPGRYELQNYAKNFHQVKAFSKGSSKALDVKKTTRNCWEIITNGESNIIFSFQYYCAQMDAGGCWLDEDQVYLNFICCLPYLPEKINSPCAVHLNLPSNYQIASGLKKKGSLLQAKDYYELVDCPMIASANLKHKQYTIDSTHFHIWIQGECQPDWQLVLSDFKKFSEEQINSMGEFPEKDYHFLVQILPYKYHHGVEHRNSTIICLGPGEQFNSESFYNDFLSISSHELYHAWNIIKIRPAEMLPYDFTKENYFNSGFIAEGITTYYGDYFLVRSKAFNTQQYFHELNLLFKRHFENFGDAYMSVADSSFDLWVDGYVSGIPNRKVSIYVKGAMIALLLDLFIRKETNNKKSLDDVMKQMWKLYGKKSTGYTTEDFQAIAENISDKKLKTFFNDFVFGTKPLTDTLKKSLSYVGCQLQIQDAKLESEKIFGFRTSTKEGRTFVELLEPDSPGDKVLAREDEIIAIDGTNVSGNLNDLLKGKKTPELVLQRFGKIKQVTLHATGTKTYFKQYKIAKNEEATEQEKNNFKKWLKHEF
jgi:predicted metalloprotease with PDZ domain